MECSFSASTDICGAEFDGYERRICYSESDTKCDECGVAISEGEACEVASGELGDETYNYSTCMACAEIAEAFMGDRLHGSLWDDMEREIEDGEEPLTTACFSKLKTVAAKRKIQDFWIKCVLGCAPPQETHPC